MTYHKHGKKEKQILIPFRIKRSTRNGFDMGKQGYTRKGKYPEEYDDEDTDTTDWDEDDGYIPLEV